MRTFGEYIFSAEELENLKLRFKFNDSILQILNKKYKNPLTYRKTYKKISKFRLPPISNETILLFYNEPKKFFENHITLLNNTSYYDELGTSIFAHYFYILYTIFIEQNNKSNLNNEIYLSNFSSFFKAHKKYITTQDFSLETPLHKLAKKRNKIFFIKYYNLLKDIDVVNEQILNIKNINNESCLDLVINEIDLNSNNLTKEDFDLYIDFLNSNKTSIESLHSKTQLDLKLFSLSINFHLKLYKDITFEEMYIGLNNLLQNVKEKIINYNYFFNQDMNILNILYHYIKNKDDFNKIFKLISEVLNTNLIKMNKLKEIIIKKKKSIEIPIHYYIYNHIGYVLRKMNKNNEINYGMKLINEILPTLLNNNSFDEFKDKEKIIKLKKLKFNNNSLGINVAKNTNLTFDKKCEILNLIENLLKEHFNEDYDEDVIYLYKLFQLYYSKSNGKKILNESSITSCFKKFKYVRKIFADFFYVGKLYRSIHFLCKQYDNINLKNYIKELNNFLMTNKEIFDEYKSSYLMNDKNILIILEIIILFEKRNYFNEIEEEYLPREIIKFNNKNKLKYEKLYQKFILSKPKLTSYYIKDIISKSQKANKKLRVKLYSEFLNIFFSFKYDFEKFASNKNMISYFSNKSKEEFAIYEKKLNDNLSNIKENKNVLSIFKFILKYSPHKNNAYIFKNIFSKFKILMRKYFNQLLFKWNEDCDFKELSELIKENIVPFCKIFLDLKDTLEDRKNKINFFFDAFIIELDSEFKNIQYQQYKQLALNYMNLIQDEEDNYFYHLDYKIYFSILLIFVRLKFGKYNPSILFTYILENKSNHKFFLLFLKSYFNDIYKDNIPNHFLLVESNLYKLYPEKYKIKFNKFKGEFFYSNISLEKYKEMLLIHLVYISPYLKKNEYSLIFDFAKSILNNNESENNKDKDKDRDKKIRYNYFTSKYLFLSIGSDQNQEIFNTTFDLIYDENGIKRFFDFLDTDTLLYTEENIKHKLKIINQISLSLKENENEVIEDIKNEIVNKQTYENMIKILKILKKEKNSFFNYVKNNRYLLKISLYYLLKNYFFYLLKDSDKKSYDLPLENEDSLLLKEEIYNFLDFYKANCLPNNEYIVDFCKIFLSLSFSDSISNIKKYLKFNILLFKIQSFNNHEQIDISFFKSILSKDLLMILFYYMYIIDSIKIQKNQEENKSNLSSNNENENENSVKEIIKYSFNLKNDEVSFILNEYSQFFDNINTKQIYDKYFTLFSNLESYSFEYDNEIDFMNKNEIDKIYLILVLLYINQKYPSYNTSILSYAYKKYFIKNSKQFFTSFIKCIRDKQNQNNIPFHLLLEKEEKIINKKNIIIDLYNAKEAIKNYVVNNLINLNYSENSLFYEFINYTIEKAIKKNKLKQIDYIIFYYTLDKNNEIYQKICDKFIELKIPYYYFLEYDSEINNEQNMIKIIKLLENLSKNTINSSQIIEESEKEEKEEDEEKKESFISLNNSISFKKYFDENKEKEIKKLHLNNSNLKENEIKKLCRIKLYKKYKIKEEVRKIMLYYTSIKNNDIEYNIVINKMVNVYAFFKVLKQQNKNLIDIIQGNFTFLIESINILLYIIIHSSFDKNKTEIINEQIYDFFSSLFINEKYKDILKNYFEEPIKIEKNELKLKLVKFFEKYFIKIINLKNESVPDIEYQAYKQIIINFCKNYYNRNSFRNTFIILFEKDINKFIDFLNIGFFDPLYHSKIIFSIMQKDLQKIFLHPELFSFISFNKMNSRDYIRLNNTIVKYILNHTKEEKYYDIEFINNSYIFKDLNLSLFCLNDIYKQKASIFVLNKIQKLFEQINDKIQLFLELIKRQINNEYVFDYLFNSFNENELTELYKNNKNDIIISLYKYSEINAVKYIQITFNNLIKFMPEEELKIILCPNASNIENEEDFPYFILKFLEESKKILQDKNEELLSSKIKDIKYKKNRKEKYNPEDIIKKKQIEYEPKKDINKYLLFYALSNSKIANYETIAYLLEQCQIEYASLCLINYLSNDLAELYNSKIMRFLNYIVNNKEKIKNIGNNLYNSFEFFEKISKILNNTLEKLNNNEKKIFYYYMAVIIFQITPKKLVQFIGNLINKNLNMENDNIIKSDLSEKELFIILAFYEIRGNTIISIHKYFPKFYSKIENIYQKFEFLNIPKLNLKSDNDIQFISDYKNLLEKQAEQYLKYIPYSSFINYILIINKEFAPNIDLIPEQFEIIEKLILNLIEKDDIFPFYKIENKDEFFENLKLIDYKIRYEKRYKMYEALRKEKIKSDKEREIRKQKIEQKINENINIIINYKSIIYSLLDFNETSSQILQNNNDLIEKYGFETETPLRIYLNYLETINEIYYAITKKNEYDFYNISFLEEYEISEKVGIKLEMMKNNINLSKIISEIIKSYENIGMSKNIFFDKIVKWINNYIKSNNNEMKEINKISGEKINIFSYFKYLVANCNIIIKTIGIFNTIKEILKYLTISRKEDNYIIKLHLDFYFSENKNTSKKNSSESLFSIGKEMVEKINNKTNIGNLFESKYKVYFYFNEKEEKFCETCSDSDLIEFVENKYQSIKNFYIKIINQYEENHINKLLYINNKLEKKDIYSLFLDNMMFYNVEIKEEHKEKIFNIFTSFLEENQNIIASYFKETSDKFNQPNYEDCICSIKYKIDNVVFNSFEPCLSMNLQLKSLFFKQNRYFFSYGYYDRIKIYKYYDYIINLDEIISAIKGAKYHSETNLNSLFQIKAINYIINDNSKFGLFILEL